MALKIKDYEERVRSMGFERATSWCMKEMIEQQRALESALKDQAEGFDQMTNIIQQFTTIAGNMKNAHAEMMAKLNPPEDTPSTHN